MFESCHSPDEVAYLLRIRFGFPVDLFAGRPFLSCGRRIDGIAMPPDMGRRVRAGLRSAPATPAVADPRNRRWVFLAAPPRPYHAAGRQLRNLMAASGVTLLAAGHRVMLPTSDYPLGWHWASEPAPGPMLLPERTAVLAAVRESIREDAHVLA
ncbi:hypothetical protein [Nocardia mexicana]|uniref:Uncharacterized protein n=1 Tax=Nocardia mexicana TaxID=279262 RepID=A0A370HDE3_9NOCA|nr:hypothetical protein [Nocardia mexicana]RDI52883.1 hypothetical protein DFR68_103270 [Nocardia mexicana]